MSAMGRSRNHKFQSPSMNISEKLSCQNKSELCFSKLWQRFWSCVSSTVMQSHLRSLPSARSCNVQTSFSRKSSVAAFIASPILPTYAICRKNIASRFHKSFCTALHSRFQQLGETPRRFTFDSLLRAVITLTNPSIKNLPKKNSLAVPPRRVMDSPSIVMLAKTNPSTSEHNEPAINVNSNRLFTVGERKQELENAG